MCPARTLLALVVPLVFSGCGFVHFGRLPATPAAGGDAALAAAYTNLATEHKILKQELVLVRREGDTLRVALERAAGGTASPAAGGNLAARLAETTRELTVLRASYAKLQIAREATPSTAAPAVTAAQADLEEKLAAALRNYTQLQEENARLRSEVDRTRTENLGLSAQLKAAAQQAERDQVIISQLNSDLIAYKEARARTEQAAEAVRTQLRTVLAHGGTAPAASAASSLELAKAPPAGSSATAELRVNTEALRPAAPPAPAAKPRVHVVQAGDTLEKISRQYYGVPERWRTVYDANTGLLSNGQPLRAGMELIVPEN